jgi:hypothetical protein
MKTPNELSVELSQFTGTVAYHRLSNKLVLTDGALHLAENAECFWLTDIVDSVLFGEINSHETFLVVKWKRNEKGGGVVEIEDGNYNLLYRQEIEFSDFPFGEYEFFVQQTANHNGQFYVALLKSEY